MPTKKLTSSALIGLLSGLALVLITLIFVDLRQQKPEQEPTGLSSTLPETDSDSPLRTQETVMKTASDERSSFLGITPTAVQAQNLASNTTASTQKVQPTPQDNPQAANQKLYDQLSIETHQSQHDEAVIGTLQKIIKNDPTDLKAYTLLGELYYQNDRLSQAIEVWEKILEIDPFNEGIKMMLAKAQREHRTEGEFTHEVTRHFRIKFEGSENRNLYKTVLDILEEAYSEVGKVLSFYPKQEIIVFLYTQKQFFDVTRAPAWTGGIFDGKIRIPAGGYEDHLDRLRQVLFHEYVHAVVHQITTQGITRVGENARSRVPTWFHEGIAQYLEPENTSENTDERLRAWIKQGVFVELTLLQGSFLGFNNQLATLAYDESLSAVRFMMEEFGPYGVQKFLNALAQSMTLDEAMRDAFFISYGEFQKRWENSLKS
jgi:tetratricopeptide (TPR) repeat protein